MSKNRIDITEQEAIDLKRKYYRRGKRFTEKCSEERNPKEA